MLLEGLEAWLTVKALALREAGEEPGRPLTLLMEDIDYEVQI